MREIKFTCWDKIKKEITNVDAIWFNFAEGPHIIQIHGENRKSDEIVLLQFTGLLDKNGNEIYEGDIIKTEGATFEVVYDKNAAAFRYEANNNSESPLNYDDVEIISNIYPLKTNSL